MEAKQLAFRKRAYLAVRKAITPNLVKEFWGRRKALREAKQEGGGRPVETKKQILVRNLIRVGGAAIIYQASAATYGVSARDSELTLSAEKAWANTSSLSLTIAGTVANSIPPHLRETAAGIIIPIELGLSAIRIAVEQKVWGKMGITPDPAGTLLTPLVAGAMEFAYKASIVYPQDTESRLAVGLIGIYGNLVRMVNAGILYVVGKVTKMDVPKTTK